MFEPVDQTHERIVVLTVEVVASRFDFDEFSNHALIRNVAQNDKLRIILDHDELVGNLRLCFGLFPD